MTLLLSALLLAGRLALVAIAGRDLLQALTVPRGSRRTRHQVRGAVVLLVLIGAWVTR